MTKILRLICTLALTTLAAASDEFPTGKPIERVACKVAEGQSYALYLPSQYSTERAWPVLFCFDPGSRGMVPIRLFQEAAERHGFILISSHNFRSDRPTLDDSFEVLIAVWNDALLRYSMDTNRLYATGFSGGARVSWILDFVTQKAPFAGIIGVGAGLPSDKIQTWLRPDLAFYGLAGETDFNYYEMLELDRLLEEATMPRRFVSFNGAHEWPGEEECSRALDWMQLQAMKKGTAPKDAGFIQEFVSEGRERASKNEEAGRLLEAHQELESLLRDLQGLGSPADGLQEALHSLGNNGRYKQLLAKRKRESKWAEQILERGYSTLNQLRQAERDSLPALRDLLFQMRVTPLLKKAEKDDPEERLAARRVLESLFVQAAFYFPREFSEKGNLEEAHLCLALATSIQPDNPFGWFRRARLETQMGQFHSAVKSLRTSLELGFSRWDLLEEDAAFDPLRAREDYSSLIEEFK